METVRFGKIKEQSYAMKESLRALKTNIQFCGDDIKTILIRITTYGSIFLVIIAAMPILFANYSKVENANISLGGTGLLIVVGVALETYKQIASALKQKEYKGRF